MSNDKSTPPPPPSEPQQTPSTIAEVPPSPPVGSPEIDRIELISRARTFLHSPQVRNEDVAAKRRFLAEKGLTVPEVEGLIRELPVQAPLIPPRTYPQPPPSNLPNLLIGLARILSWLAGSSAVLLFLYFRHIYPRLSKSYEARIAIRNHQKDLFQKLTTSLESYKTTQLEAYADLPRPLPYKEDKKYQEHHNLEGILTTSENVQDIPLPSLLRCAIEELVSKKEAVTSQAIFDLLENRIPLLQTDEGAPYIEKMWETLNTTPIFKSEETEGATVWLYVPLLPPTVTPILSSMTTLKDVMPSSPPPTNRYQHTYQALVDFTGYLTGQLYALRNPYRGPGAGNTSPVSSQEEDIRREIKALKGLILNRRSFMPTIPRPSAPPNPIVTP
ncbi:hypothetical protein C8Q75DRAFT_742879 [Abortiporus biennis]|nr:hypothetical protein C8Q75DRAFT_742879 [Abortiporus biennis]